MQEEEPLIDFTREKEPEEQENQLLLDKFDNFLDENEQFGILGNQDVIGNTEALFEGFRREKIKKILEGSVDLE